MTIERRKGATPAGGVSSEAYYCDEDGNEVEKRDATHVRIRELGENDELIAETFGELGPGLL